MVSVKENLHCRREQKNENKPDVTIFSLSDQKGELPSGYLSFYHDQDESVRPT